MEEIESRYLSLSYSTLCQKPLKKQVSQSTFILLARINAWFLFQHSEHSAYYSYLNPLRVIHVHFRSPSSCF